MVPKRTIGSTGIEVSAIGLGTVKIGRNQGVKYPEAFDLPSDDAVVALFELARELGINLIDTAPAYGVSEERVGQLLPGPREDWVLSTKLGEEFENGESFFDFSADHAKRSIERSLERLRTDRLDVVLIHSDGNDVANLECPGLLDVLASYKSEGVIRSYGLSSKSVQGGVRAIELGCDLVMTMYNPWYTDEREVLEVAEQQGASVFIKKAFASGHFGKGQGDPVAQALNYILERPSVASVILGTINPGHLRQNCEAVF